MGKHSYRYHVVCKSFHFLGKTLRFSPSELHKIGEGCSETGLKLFDNAHRAWKLSVGTEHAPEASK